MDSGGNAARVSVDHATANERDRRSRVESAGRLGTRGALVIGPRGQRLRSCARR